MKTILTPLLILISFSLFAQPANDLCSNAETIFDGDCLPGTLTDANDNISGETGCGTNGNAGQHSDVWYSFTATGTTIDLDVTNISETGQMELALFDGTCGGVLGELGCDSENNADPSISYGSLIIGNIYFILVSHSRNNQDDFTLCIDITSPPSSSPNTDCATATPLCDNNTFNGNSNGFGTQEVGASNAGCLSFEHQSSWYTFTIQTSGTLDMTVSPQNGSDDYDFALWGPNPDCTPTTAPMRCSFASGFTTDLETGSYNTGFGSPGTGPTDGSGADVLDGWSSSINVLAGETYILLVDNFSSSGSPFDLNWGGTASMDCSVLPIELVNFKGEFINGGNYVTWQTLSEINNDYFSLERSTDMVNFEEITVINGAGNSVDLNDYSFLDRKIINETYYYRLKQVDFDGASTYSEVISINGENKVQLVKIVNVMGQVVSADAQGIKFYVYDNGMIDKRY